MKQRKRWKTSSTSILKVKFDCFRECKGKNVQMADCCKNNFEFTKRNNLEIFSKIMKRIELEILSLFLLRQIDYKSRSYNGQSVLITNKIRILVWANKSVIIIITHLRNRKIFEF